MQTYPENFREDIRETLRPLKREQVISNLWNDPLKHCGCPIVELIIHKGIATREVCERELNGASYFDLTRGYYPFNVVGAFINDWDDAYLRFKNFTPLEVANLIFRKDDERSGTVSK